MNIKKSICILLVFFIFFTACSGLYEDQVEAVSHKTYESISSNQSSAPDLGADDTLDSNQPTDEISDKSELYIDPAIRQIHDSGREVVFPSNSQYTPPEESFLEALHQAYNDDYDYLRDRDNFFQIKDYLLYFKSDGFIEPSKIIILAPNGKITELLAITQPIDEISFLSEHELLLKFIKISGGNGEYGHSYYTVLDLRTGRFNRFTHDLLVHNFVITQKLYDGVILIENTPNLDPSFRVDIYRVDGIARTLILSETQLPSYANGYIYFKRSNDFYRSDLFGNETKILTFPSDVYSMVVFGNILIYSLVPYGDNREFHVMYFENETITSIDAVHSIAGFDGITGNIYFWDTDRNLYVFNNEGETKRLIDSFSGERYPIYFSDDWIYYRTYEQFDTKGIELAQYWRIRMDGSELTREVF